MYRVLARQWRPQNFDDLVGQPQVARTLGNAITHDRLAHAYVFAGLRGTGKTTVARILAKCLNCEKGPTATPCGTCMACQEIAESRAMDVLELDAASRTGIEDIRELQELISYSPARDRYKMLILDEVHMLSPKAFNALLKTLEEPPDRVVFVLATTELNKIPATILSRCQVFEFRRIAAPEVVGHLRKICDAEKIRISEAALDRLARAGEGSIRDSLSLLERALAFCGQEVPDEEILRMLGAVKTQVLVDLVGALARRDAGDMLRVLDGLIDEGHDLIHFWNEVITALRDLLLSQTLPGRTDLLARSPDEAAALSAAALGLSREDLTRAFQILADLEPALKSSSQPQFLFEATLIRLSSLGAVRPIEEILHSLGGTAVTAPSPAPPAPKKKERADAPVQAPLAAGAAQLVEAVRAERPMIAAMLEHASVELGQGKLLVRLPAGMDALKRQLESKDNLSLLKRLGGPGMEVRIEVTGSDNASPPADLLEQARQEPGIRSLLDTFGAQVVEIRPLERSEHPTLGGKRPRTLEETP